MMVNVSSFVFDFKLNILLFLIVLTVHSRSQASDQDKQLYCEDKELLISYNHPSIQATSFNEPPLELLPLIKEDAGLIKIKDGLIYYQGQSYPMTTGPHQTLQGKNLVYWSGPQGMYSYVLDHQGQMKILPRFVMVKNSDPIKFTVYHTDMVATSRKLSDITKRVHHNLALQERKEALTLCLKNRPKQIEKIEEGYRARYTHSANRVYANPNYQNWPAMQREIAELDLRTKAMQREIEDLEKNPYVPQGAFGYVASAGDITIKNGKISRISNQSGHLRTSPLQFALAVKQLAEQNLLADDCQFEMLEVSYEDYVLDLGGSAASGSNTNPTHGIREKILTSQPSRQQLLAKAVAFLQQEKSLAHTTSPLYGEKISCRGMPLDAETSFFDVSKARHEGFLWGLLNETQFNDVLDRMVEFGHVDIILSSLKALDNDTARARLFNQSNLLSLALKHKSEKIFQLMLSQSDQFLSAVLRPNIVQSIDPSDATLASKLVGLAWQMMPQHQEQKVVQLFWLILDRVPRTPHSLPALEILLSKMLIFGHPAAEVMRVVDSFDGLRLLPRLSILMSEYPWRALAFWQAYVEDNPQFKPFQKLCALKKQVVDHRPLDYNQLRAYTILAQEITTILELMVKLLSDRNENADLFLGYLITLHGGSLESYGNSRLGNSCSEISSTVSTYGQTLGPKANCLVSVYDAQILSIQTVHQSDEKLSSYYLALSKEYNPILRLLGIHHLMQFLWPDKVYSNPPLGVPAQHEGLRTLEKNTENRRKLFAAYKKLMDIKSGPSLDNNRLVIDFYRLLYPLGHAKSHGAYGHPLKQPLHYYIDHLINVLFYKPHLLRGVELGNPYKHPELIERHLNALVEDAEDYLYILDYALTKDPTYEKNYQYSWTDSYELYRQPRLVGQWDITGYLKPPSFLGDQGELLITINKKTVAEALLAYRNKKDHPLLFALGVLFLREKR